MKAHLLILLVILFSACSHGNNNSDEEIIDELELYFPSLSTSDWETKSVESLNWDESKLESLYDFLQESDTRAFLVLKDGKIVIEKYWGNTILNTGAFDQNSNWYWASAGKTLTSFLVGIAEQEGLLRINDKTSAYLGENWSDLSLEKENLILIKHQLTMTTGLDYTVSTPDCTDKDCLKYKEDAGSQWFYHNAPYTLLEHVVSSAAGVTYNAFTDETIEAEIGMNGTWRASGDNNVYWSTARDAARFGLLLLNKGAWEDKPAMLDEDYLNAMIHSSQNLNPSYGYLTWLNGKSSIVLPGLAASFNVPLSEDAPEDLFAAMGKNGQFIDVVPSKGIVVIRMGDAPDNSLVPSVFHNDMWTKLNAVIN